MSSILTNTAAMTALKSLQATNQSMEMVQSRISTGLEVAEAADNAAYWSIATTMRSDNAALSTVQDALGLGAAKIDIAYTATNSAIEVVDQMKSKLVAAREPGVDRTKIQSELTELQAQLRSIADSASFSGENWLSVDSSDTDYQATKSIVSSFSRASDGSVAVSTIAVNTGSVELIDVNDDSGILDTEFTTPNGATPAVNVVYSVLTLDITLATVDDTVIDGMISNVDAALQSMTTAASDLGAYKSRIEMQSNFVTALMDAIERGVGELVDADMTEESTRLQALQVQQQLGVQALSIANGNAQNILALFQ